jgi:hypothetical protein
VISLTLPPDNGPTLRQQLAEMANSDQHASMGMSGLMFSPANVLGRFQLHRCPDCEDDYVSKETLDRHECPARPGGNKEDDNASKG